MALTEEYIGIQIKLEGYEEATSRWNRLIRGMESDMSHLGNVDAFSKWDKELKELDADYRRLKQQKLGLEADLVKAKDAAEMLAKALKQVQPGTEVAKMLGENYQAAQEKIKQTNAEIKQTGLKMRETKTRADDLKKGMKSFADEAKIAGQTFQQSFMNVAQTTRHVGGALQSLGRGLQGLTSFGGRILNGIFMGMGFRLVNTLTSGFSGALERSDTFKTYGKTMQALMPGLSAGQTSNAIEKLNDAVLGLPTGLDEIVESQKMYTLSMGDFEKATNMAIAANNAFLASNASEEATNTGQRMLNTLMATGKLTAKQWMSLQRTMPVALAAVGREMGYTDGQVGMLVKDLQTGAVSIEDFTDAFIKVGTSGALKDATDVMKETYSAIFANWQNAVKRLGQNVLDTLSKTLEETTGKNIYQWLLKVKDGIDKVSLAIQGWIKANPDRIKEFFNTLLSIDWFGFLKGIAKGLETVFGMLRQAVGVLTRLFGENGMERLGKFLIVGNVYGRIITVIGSFIRGLSPVLGVLGTLAKKAHVGKFLKFIISPLTKLFGKLKVLGKGAKAAEKGAEAVGGVMKSVGGWQSVAKMGIAVAAIPAIAGAIKILASAMKDIDGLNLTWFSNGSKTGVLKAIGMMATALGAFAGIATGLGALYSIPGIGWIATYSLGKGIAIILAISGAVTALTSMLNEIATAEFPSADRIEELKEKMKDIVPMLDELVDIINDGDKSAREIKDDAETATAYADVVTAVSNIGKEMQALAEMSITIEQIESAKQTISDIGAALDELSGVVTDVFGEKLYNTEGTIEANLTGNGFVGTRFDTEAVQAMADTAKAFADIFSGFDEIINNINALNELINGLIESGALSEDENGLQLDTVKRRLNNIADALYEMLNGAESPFIRLKTVAKSFSNTDLSSITKGFTEAGKIIAEVEKLKEPLEKWVGSGEEKISGPGGTETPIFAVTTKLGTLATKLEEIANSFVKVRRLDDFAKNASYAKKAVDDINALVATLGTIKTNFDAGSIDSVSDSIRTMVETLSVSLAGAALLAVEATEFKAAVDVFKVSVDTLTGVAGSDGLAQIPKALRDIEDAMNHLTTVMSGIGSKWHDAVISGFNAPDIRQQIAMAFLSIAMNISSGAFYQAGYSAGASFASGVRTAVRGGIGSAFSSLTYRAKGGSVFKKRGTDTVPAMLTPGEFVMRRKAVGTFGTDFMRKVNALDIKGAMASLMMRGGAHIMPTYGASVTNNNTVNKTNNARVTQNIYSNNPNFAYRRANRWVGAL